MLRIALGGSLLLSLAGAVAIGCGSASERSGELADESCPAPCETVDAGAPDPDADTFKGKRVTLGGTVGYSDPPDFPPFPSDSTTFLPSPALVHYPFAGHDYQATFSGGPSGTFTMNQIPYSPDEVIALVTDVDGKNAIYPTFVPATPDDGVTWNLSAVRLKAITDICAANNVKFDPNAAHAVLSVLQADEFGGLTPVSGVTVDLTGSAEAVLVDTPAGTFTPGKTTGPLGMMIFINTPGMPPLPGKTVALTYTVPGGKPKTLQQRLMAGAIARVAIANGF